MLGFLNLGLNNICLLFWPILSMLLGFSARVRDAL